jgi:hypothetical protein
VLIRAQMAQHCNLRGVGGAHNGCAVRSGAYLPTRRFLVKRQVQHVLIVGARFQIVHLTI